MIIQFRLFPGQCFSPGAGLFPAGLSGLDLGLGAGLLTMPLIDRLLRFPALLLQFAVLIAQLTQLRRLLLDLMGTTRQRCLQLADFPLPDQYAVVPSAALQA